MRKIVGIFRLITSVLTVIVGAALVLLTSWIPVYLQSARLSAWVVVGAARILLMINQVQVNFTNKDALKTHSGFILANHTTYLDILVLSAYFPVRFLAMEEVRSWPLIGYAASSIGCVFVDREDKVSRTQARQALANIAYTPPLVIYPEGKIGSGETLSPFHSGSFQIAVQKEVALLPCAILYNPWEIVVWGQEESLLDAFMRVCNYNDTIYVTLACLPTVYPNMNDDAVALSLETHEQLEQRINQYKLERISV